MAKQTDPRLLQAMQAIASGQTEQADMLCRSVLAEKKRNDLAMALLAQVCNATDNYEEAMQLIRSAIAKNNKRADYHGLLADMLTTRGDFKGALASYDKALKLQLLNTKIEFKIVRGAMIQEGVDDEGFAKKLVDWADIIRKTFYDDAIDEVISTRRLVHIVKAFSIFKDKLKAINLCVARFDNETKDAFLDLYTKIDAGVSLDNETNEETSATPEGESNGESSED